MVVVEQTPAISTIIEIEQRECNNACIIDIPADLEYELWSKCCIQRVPKKLRKVNEAAYTPQLLSIGPFHHGEAELLGMEQHKKRYYDEFCKRTGKKEADLKRFIFGHHEEILCSYAGTVKFRKDAFLDIILIDACFILELFLRNSEGCRDDYILKTPWLRRDVELDLILFENQIPYAFLKQLFDFVATPPPTEPLDTSDPTTMNQDLGNVPLLSAHWHGNSTSHHPLSKHTRDFFSHTRHADESETDHIKHFTDLIRKVLCPKKVMKSQNNISYLYSAKRLATAGISFVPCQNQRLADLEMVPGAFDFLCCMPCLQSTQVKLPEFFVQDDTECVLRNAMALEQCIYPDEAHLCSYILFLDQLVNTVEDVDLLVQKKVIKHLLGSNDAVAKLINKMCDQIVETNSCYYDVSEQLNAYCENCCNSTKATIKRTYFKDCWTANTAIFGFCVTLFSVLSIIKGLFF